MLKRNALVTMFASLMWMTESAGQELTGELMVCRHTAGIKPSNRAPIALEAETEFEPKRSGLSQPGGSYRIEIVDDVSLTMSKPCVKVLARADPRKVNSPIRADVYLDGLRSGGRYEATIASGFGLAGPFIEPSAQPVIAPPAAAVGRLRICRNGKVYSSGDRQQITIPAGSSFAPASDRDGKTVFHYTIETTEPLKIPPTPACGTVQAELSTNGFNEAVSHNAALRPQFVVDGYAELIVTVASGFK